MANDAGDHKAPTRRDTIKYGGTIAIGGLFAGCTGESESESAPPEEEASANEKSESTRTEKKSSVEDSYSVFMEPMGEVSFETVPEQWMAYFTNYGDMAIGLGQLDGLQGLIFTDNWPLEFYEHLPGVEVAFDDVPQLLNEGGLDKEIFYEMDCDVHLFDPNFIQKIDNSWTNEDFEEVVTNISPIIGNTIRRRNENWHDYEYYSLYEAFEKIATVFQEPERYEAIKHVHDDLIAEVQSRLPAEEERPTVGLLSAAGSDFEEGSFWAYPIKDGAAHKQYRDLGMRGAFDDVIDAGAAQWDYEQILDVDPDALVFQYGFSHLSTEEFEQRMDTMREDPVGQQLQAVKNDRLYRGGTSYQGPIINLFQTEAAAKQFYPAEFGEWNGLEELLFDRQPVADAINGDI